MVSIDSLGEYVINQMNRTNCLSDFREICKFLAIMMWYHLAIYGVGYNGTK